MVSQPPRDYNHTAYIVQNSTRQFDFAKMNDQLWMYLLVVFVASAVIFLMTLVYFPAKPRKPPSKSASRRRLHFKSLLELLRNPRIWHITVVCSSPLAIFGNWIGLLDVHFHRAGISQTEAGWIGLISSLGGAVSGILIGRIADFYQRHLKGFTIALYTIAFLSQLWTVLMIMTLVPHSVVLLGVSTTLINAALNAATPLIYEMSCETGYPAAEEIMAMLIGLCLNLGGVMYLLIQLIPHIGTLWMTWAFCGVQALSIPALAFFRDRYNRLDIDRTSSKKFNRPRQNRTTKSDIDGRDTLD